MTAPVPGAVLACGHPPTPTTRYLGTGYVYTEPGGDAPAVCYQCGDVLERVRLAATPPGEAFGTYPSSDGRTITTWSGGELARVTAHWTSRRGAFGREIHYWQAIGPDGRRYHGRNAGPGMYLALRPSKVTVR